MGRALHFDHETSRWALPAGVLSIAAHLSLLFAVAKGAELLPPDESLSPLRFVGQTFDVDALGEDNQEEARAPASDSAPSAEARLDELPPEIAPEPDEPDDEVVLEQDEQKPTAPPIREAERPPRQAEKHPKESPAETEPKIDLTPTPRPAKSPVDPFDLAVPGDSSTSAAPSAPSDTGSYGADGKPAAITDVFKAFLHLFPEANRHNPAWQDLPLGKVGRVEFSLLIGDNARLVSIEIHDRQGAPPKLLIDAIRKTQTYLIHQRLGWEGKRRAGRQRLALTVVVQKMAPHRATPEREGIRRHGRYGESRPTGAFFTFYDGHHIDIELERVSTEVQGP